MYFRVVLNHSRVYVEGHSYSLIHIKFKSQTSDNPNLYFTDALLNNIKILN